MPGFPDDPDQPQPAGSFSASYNTEGYRIVANRPAKIRLRLDDETGALADATALPTVTVVNGGGGAVTVGVVTDETGTGIYSVTIPARSQLDRLTATWVATMADGVRTVVMPVDVVGQRLLEFSRIKEDPEFAGLDQHNLWRLLDIVEEWFRTALGYPPVLEGGRSTMSLAAARTNLVLPDVWLPDVIYSVLVDDVALGQSDLDAIGVTEDGRYAFTTGRLWAAGNYRLHYSHGLVTPGQDLRLAAADLAREINRKSNYPQRATSVTTDKSTINFIVPTPDRPTGIPSVDGHINRYRREVIV